MFSVRMKRKHKSWSTSPTVNSTAPSLSSRYDKLAFRYVSYVAIPCLAGYTIYSLLYESHKGWYSFIISTLTSFVYMFGFVRSFQRPDESYANRPNGRHNLSLSSLSTTSSSPLHICPWKPWYTRHSLPSWTISLRKFKIYLSMRSHFAMIFCVFMTDSASKCRFCIV